MTTNGILHAESNPYIPNIFTLNVPPVPDQPKEATFFAYGDNGLTVA